MKTIWHLRVRGVVSFGGKILVCRHHDAGYVFLPGGHVEEGESMPVALLREMREETGFDFELGGYIGAIENSWEKDSERHWEVCHYFRLTINEEKLKNITPAEEGFDFLWIKADEFKEYNLLPEVSRELLSRFQSGDNLPFFASQME